MDFSYSYRVLFQADVWLDTNTWPLHFMGCYGFECVFYMRISLPGSFSLLLAGSFSIMGKDSSEAETHFEWTRSHFVPFGQQWRLSSQHTACREKKKKEFHDSHDTTQSQRQILADNKVQIHSVNANDHWCCCVPINMRRHQTNWAQTPVGLAFRAATIIFITNDCGHYCLDGFRQQSVGVCVCRSVWKWVHVHYIR